MREKFRMTSSMRLSGHPCCGMLREAKRSRTRLCTLLMEETPESTYVCEIIFAARAEFLSSMALRTVASGVVTAADRLRRAVKLERVQKRAK